MVTQLRKTRVELVFLNQVHVLHHGALLMLRGAEMCACFRTLRGPGELPLSLIENSGVGVVWNRASEEVRLVGRRDSRAGTHA